MILVFIFGGLTEERGKRGTMCLRNDSGKRGPKDQVALHHYHISPSHWCTTHGPLLPLYVRTISRYSVPPSAGPLLPLRNEIIISAALKWIILPLLCEGRPLTDALNGRRVRQSGEAMMNVEVGESDRLAAPELTTKRRHVDPRHGRRRRRRATANCFRFWVELVLGSIWNCFRFKNNCFRFTGNCYRFWAELLPVLSVTASGLERKLLPVPSDS